VTIKVEGLKVLCDGECGYKPGFCTHRCSVETQGALTAAGKISVEMPDGWTQDEGRVFGRACSERRSLEKVLRAPLPDPEDDPPHVKRARAKHVEVMREVVKEDLKGESDLEAKVAHIREIAERGDDADFAGHFGGHQVEVRVREDHVEIGWPNNKVGMSSITLRHEGLELIDPPPFLDERMVAWIQNCLRTLEGEPLQKSNRAVN
jgi:hypothetical protein